MTLTRFADKTIDCRASSDPTLGLAQALAGLDPRRTVEVLVADSKQAGAVRAWCDRQHHPMVDMWTRDDVIHIYVRP